MPRLGVVASRITVLGLIACSLPLCAQPSQGHFTIRVTDTAGAVIPNAQVQIDPERPSGNSCQKTENLGEFACEVPVGTHTLTVVAPAFQQWTNRINVESGFDQHVDAVLRVGSYSGPSVVPDNRDYASKFLRFPEEPVLLQTVPLAMLPLASIPVKTHEKKAKL